MNFLPQSKVQDKLDSIAVALMKGQVKVVEVESTPYEVTYTMIVDGAELKLTEVRPYGGVQHWD